MIKQYKNNEWKYALAKWCKLWHRKKFKGLATQSLQSWIRANDEQHGNRLGVILEFYHLEEIIEMGEPQLANDVLAFIDFKVRIAIPDNETKIIAMFTAKLGKENPHNQTIVTPKEKPRVDPYSILTGFGESNRILEIRSPKAMIIRDSTP